MIHPDLTEILAKFCDWDYVVQRRYLNYAKKMIQEQTVVTYKGIEYRLIDDLQCDLEAECLEQENVA